MGSKAEKSARQRCQAYINALRFAPSADGYTFCEALSHERNRPIILYTTDMEAIRAGLWGLWVADESADFVLYEKYTDPDHQNHIILHEAGHIVMGHEPGAFLGGLGPRLILRALGRSLYSTDEEVEAETFATLVRQHTADEMQCADTGADPESEELRHRLGVCL